MAHALLTHSYGTYSLSLLKVDLEKPWTPDMMTTSDAAPKPEVSKLAKLLGDDSGDSEWDVSDAELDAECDDPLEKEPIWVQVRPNRSHD